MECFMSHLGCNLFQKANEKGATASFCLFLARLPHSSVKERYYFILIIPACKHKNQSQLFDDVNLFRALSGRDRQHYGGTTEVPFPLTCFLLSFSTFLSFTSTVGNEVSFYGAPKCSISNE